MSVHEWLMLIGLLSLTGAFVAYYHDQAERHSVARLALKVSIADAAWFAVTEGAIRPGNTTRPDAVDDVDMALTYIRLAKDALRSEKAQDVTRKMVGR